MKLLPLLIWIGTLVLIAACATDSTGHQQLDTARLLRAVRATEGILDAITPRAQPVQPVAPAQPIPPAFRSTRLQLEPEPSAEPADPAARTLYHEGRTITPVVVLNGKVVDL